MDTVRYGRYRNVAEIPNLVAMQTQSYRDFLQPGIAPSQRAGAGLEALLREIFPIYSYDKTLCLEYISYELGRPRYTPEECRKLRITYVYPDRRVALEFSTCNEDKVTVHFLPGRGLKRIHRSATRNSP